MGILYLFVLVVAVGMAAVLGAFIGLTIGLMSAPFTSALLGLIAGALIGLIAGLILVIRVNRDYMAAATPPGEMKCVTAEDNSPNIGLKCEL
jgi:F0F1-type ATP synthase assembly protein I